MIKVGKNEYATMLFDAEESWGGSKEINVWDVYQQRWYRTSTPSPMIMASLPVEERDAVMAHLAGEVAS